LNDTEVAERLSIARRTGNIMNRLGVNSRTAAATWLVEHGVNWRYITF
jgi:DNA-binding NarL/FixJ family response regulator